MTDAQLPERAGPRDNSHDDGRINTRMSGRISGRVAAFWLFAASVCWGVCIPIMKVLGGEQSILAPEAGSLVGSAASLAARFALAAVTAGLATRAWPWRIRAAEWKHGSILGVITAVSMFLQVDGIGYTSASVAGFLIALYCVLIPAISWMMRKRAMTPILALCCILVLAGVAVLSGLRPGSLHLGRGEGESLAAASLFAVQILWVDRIDPVRCHTGRITTVLCAVVAGCCLLALSFLPGGWTFFPTLHGSTRALLLTGFLGLCGTAAPFLIMNAYQGRLGPVTAGFIYCFEPIASAVGALFLPELLSRTPGLYPNEGVTLKLLLGGALILAANLLLLRDRSTAPELG